MRHILILWLKHVGKSLYAMKIGNTREDEDEVLPAFGRTIRGTLKGVPAASAAPPADLGPPVPLSWLSRPAGGFFFSGPPELVE